MNRPRIKVATHEGRTLYFLPDLKFNKLPIVLHGPIRIEAPAHNGGQVVVTATAQ